MTETRTCQQCGRAFVPRREHARFCSGRCRVAWNRETLGEPAVEVSALRWSITAMGEAVERLSRDKARDRGRAFAPVADAVWWVTMVDATLVRYYPGRYDRMLAAQTRAEQQRVEDTLAGFRFVRNQMSREPDRLDFIEAGTALADGEEQSIADWVWRPVPEPAPASVPPRGRAWELGRYRAYRAQLAGHTIGESFGRAAAFLQLTAASATGNPDVNVHIAR